MHRFARLVATAWFATAVTQATPYDHQGGSYAALAAAADDDGNLTPRLSLDVVIERALAYNPDVTEARARAQASAAAARAAAGLDDPEFKYEAWNLPFNQPAALQRADSHLLGMRQTFPAWGSRAARMRIGDAEAQMAIETQRTREQDIVTQVRKAYYDLIRSEQEISVHREHAQLAERVVELTRAEYRAGRHTQPEVLQTMVELTRLHTDVVGLEQEQSSSRAMLNLLMGRAVGAALGTPTPIDPTALSRRANALVRIDEPTRPEVQLAERAVGRAEATLDRARREATYPSLTLGADYWNNPTRDTVSGFGTMLMVNLPWLSSRRREEVRKAEGELAADRSALIAVRNNAAYQVEDARARTRSAEHTYRLVDSDLVPRSRQSFQAAEAAFAAGQGDAIGVLMSLRGYLEVRLEHTRALVRFAQNLADLERALGRLGNETPEGTRHD